MKLLTSFNAHKHELNLMHSRVILSVVKWRLIYVDLNIRNNITRQANNETKSLSPKKNAQRRGFYWIYDFTHFNAPSIEWFMKFSISF